MSKRKKHFGSPAPAGTAPGPAVPAGSPTPPWWSFVLVLAATFLAYLPTLGAGFTWNDSDYVTAPALQSFHGLYRIWFELGATQQYYPLLHSAFWLEHRFWGDNPAGYHAINIAFHATSACLLTLVVWRLAGARALDRRNPAGWVALLAGLAFALHPVCVESVAWVTEQKNTLSTMAYLGAVVLYLKFDGGGTDPGTGNAGERPAAVRRSPAAYFLALACFVVAILSKSVAATLPGALLVLAWWRRGGLSWRRDVGPLVPWFVIGAAVGLFTGYVEKKYIGAEGGDFTFTALDRILIAGRVIWFYLGKTVWPAHLIFIYPRWKIDPSAAWQYLFPLGVLALLAALFGLLRMRGNTAAHRAPLAAFLLFLGALFPLLGFFNVYAFVFSFVADHWQYLALPGILVLAAAGWGILVRRAAAAGAGLAGALLFVLALALLGTLGARTWRECGAYRDQWTFYNTILSRNPASWMARNNLGNLYFAQGLEPQAKAQYAEALRLRPDYPDAHNNMGVVLLQEGRVEEALAHTQEALRLVPRYADALNNTGLALARQGKIEAAIGKFRAALAIRPTYLEALVNLGNNLYISGHRDEAIASYETALRINPNYGEALNNLGVTMVETGRPAQALPLFERVLRFNPGYADGHNDYGNALRALGRWPEALAQYQAAVRLAPDREANLRNLGDALNQVGRAPEGVLEEQAALRLDPKDALAEIALGNALVLSGRMPEGVEAFRRAVELAPQVPTYHNDLGIALIQAHREAESIPEFQAAIKLQPDYAYAHNNLGAALADLGRVAEASVQYREALRLNPKYAEVHNNLGVVLAGMGRLAEAEAEYREALRLKPDFANAHENLARVLRATGRAPETDTPVQSAARLNDPRRPDR